ncbi:hypothetical protein [Amycolatopsis speibonae]|uniref:Secreted protein n=1 Tax=Amycolatopsis speibonae TaxID=1450224 RepID=A0ABV7NU05_9PSEU
MNVAVSVITPVVALIGVFLGGWLSYRNQDRLWWRDHERQWRDQRLSIYQEFLAASREYIAFALEPTAKIVARPHPRLRGHLMPYFDEAGRPYKEHLEAGMVAVCLVADTAKAVETSPELVRSVRQIAAWRADHEAGDRGDELFDAFWAAEAAFVAAARDELGLTPGPRAASP